MSDKPVMYLYPGCTSCRKAEAWLSERGVEVEKRHVWNEAPSLDELKAMAALRPGGARDLLSTRSRRYQEMKEEVAGLEGDALLELLAREPKMLRRPLITDGRRCVVGYDPDGLAAMFEH